MKKFWNTIWMGWKRFIKSMNEQNEIAKRLELQKETTLKTFYLLSHKL